MAHGWIQQFVCCGTIVACALSAMPLRAESLQLRPAAGNDFVETQPIAKSGHLQGIAADDEAVYWGFTSKLLKTDGGGKTIREIAVIDHHGDLTFANGKLYVAVNDRASTPPGEFNARNPINPQRQSIYEYDADLRLIARHAVPEVVYGAGGIAHAKGRFLVVGGLATSENENYVFEYDASFRHVATHRLTTGYTKLGIQTAAFAEGHWWFGTYHQIGQQGTRQLFRFDKALRSFRQFSFDASLGIAEQGDGTLLVASNRRLADGRYVGRVQLAAVDDEHGLRIISIPRRQP